MICWDPNQTTRLFVIVEKTQPCEFKPRGEMGGETDANIHGFHSGRCGLCL